MVDQRDPRIDPRPGDVLAWGESRAEVAGVGHESVSMMLSVPGDAPRAVRCTIEVFRRDASWCEVLAMGVPR